MLKRTPLYQAHQKLGAKLIDFGGWEMPVQYSGIIDEHLAVRSSVGLFDISHMGEIFVSGPAAEDFLNRVLTNDARKMAPNEAQYSLLCFESGGTVDDLYVYRVGEESYLLIVNASGVEKDAAWLETQRLAFQYPEKVKVANASANFAALALQGPRAADVMNACFPDGLSLFNAELSRPSQLKKNQIGSIGLSVGNNDYGAFIARTGYTGEDGFELVLPAEIAEAIWQKVLNLGQVYGLKPAGLGARDTLRLEMGYPLYGHELNEEITPIEAGLGYFVSFDKGDFLGKVRLLQQKKNGPERKLIAFKMKGKSPPPRADYPIWSALSGGEKNGWVSSGTQSPSLGAGIGMGFVPAPLAQTGREIGIEIRGALFPAEIVSKPIYKKPV